MRDGFIFYKSFYESIKKLPKKEKIIILEAIMEYQFEEKTPQLEGIPCAIFTLIKPQLDANNTRYENGKKGGAPKRKQEPKANLNVTETEPNDNQTITKVEPKRNQKLTETEPKEKEKEKEKEKVKEKVKVNDKEKGNAAEAEKEKEKGLGFSTEPPAAAPKANIYDFYYNNINPMPTPREIEILDDYTKDTPMELIQFAMEKAVENKARSMAYIKGILNSWRAKGITTRAEAEEESAAKNKTTSKTTNKEPEAMKNVLARFMEKHKQEKEEPDGI